ncbi:MAG: PadR family transcriptional regulator [Candidatus Heimdallarchaeota archaeon]
MEANHLENESTFEIKAEELLKRWMRGYRRGSLRFFILHLLLHHSRHENMEKSQLSHGSKPRSYHGYHLAQTIRDITEGKWHPKTASIYPILKELKDEGIIEEVPQSMEETGRGSKHYRLTSFGKKVGAKLEDARMEFSRPLFEHGSMKSILPLLRLASTHDEEKIDRFLESVDQETLKKVYKQLERAIHDVGFLQERIGHKMDR